MDNWAFLSAVQPIGRREVPVDFRSARTRQLCAIKNGVVSMASRTPRQREFFVSCQYGFSSEQDILSIHQDILSIHQPRSAPYRQLIPKIDESECFSEDALSNAGGGGESGGGGGGGGGGRDGSSGDGDSDKSSNPLMSFWAWYMRALSTKPMLTRCLTSGIITGAGDLLAQQFDNVWPYNMRRIAVMTVTGGVYIAPLLHEWYTVLWRMLPGRDNLSVFGKVALDQFAWAPFFQAGIFVCIGALEGKSWTQIKEMLRDSWWTAWRAGWFVWIPAQYINMRVIPQDLQLLWVNLVSVGWNAYFSLIAHESKHAKSPGERQVAS